MTNGLTNLICRPFFCKKKLNYYQLKALLHEFLYIFAPKLLKR